MGVNISILGSINLDTTYHISHIPLPGETIHVKRETSAAGGKGANQAIAAQRSGSFVHFIGSVGNDSAGQYMLKTMRKDGIDLSNVKVDLKDTTGAATILLNEKGQNSILVYSGANNSIDIKQIQKAKKNDC